MSNLSRSSKIIQIRKPILALPEPEIPVESFLPHEFTVSQINTTASIGYTFSTTYIGPSSLEDSFEFTNGWPDTIPDSLVNPPLDFNAAESSLTDSFETADAWP